MYIMELKSKFYDFENMRNINSYTEMILRFDDVLNSYQISNEIVRICQEYIHSGYQIKIILDFFNFENVLILLD